jgi:hypothetical protein
MNNERVVTKSIQVNLSSQNTSDVLSMWGLQGYGQGYGTRVVSDSLRYTTSGAF